MTYQVAFFYIIEVNGSAMSFESEWVKQKLIRQYDYLKLGNLMIEEVAMHGHLPSASFEIIKEILGQGEFQKSTEMYYMISALRDDGVFLSVPQLLELQELLLMEDFSHISESNAYGLLDSICDLYDKENLRKIFDCMKSRSNLREAATYMIDKL